VKQFRYKAKKGPREIVEGTLTAASRDEAVDLINELGLIPIDVSPEPIGKKKGAVSKTKTARPRKIRRRDLLAFYRQLGRLVKSGIPILRVLTLMAQENENPTLVGILQKIQEEVREGSSLSTALAGYPRVFSGFDIGMIQTGESAGRIEESLAMVAMHHEQQEEISGKLRTAIAYPLFLVVAGFFTVCFMLTVIIPRFARFFSDLGQELPLITRALIAVSDFMQLTWWGWLTAGALVIFAVKRGLKKPAEKIRFHRWLLGVPKLGRLMLKAEVARLCRTLFLLLKSGIPIVQAVRMVLPALGNEAVKHDLHQSALRLEQGGCLSDALRNTSRFPPLMYHFIGIGEESGRLDEALNEIADWYERDTAEGIKILTNLLEPVIILSVGLILGLIIIAVLLPVFSINTMAV